MARHIAQQADSLRQNNARVQLSFEVTFTDNSSIEQDDISIFDGESELSLKTPESITITLSSYDPYYKISCSIVQRYFSSSNSSNVLVSGDDTQWVTANFDRLIDIIDASPKQDAFINSHRAISNICLSIPIFWLYLSIWWFSIRLWSHKWPIDILSIVIVCLVLFAAGLSLFNASSLSYWLSRLWPDIEIDVGPEHMKLIKRRRTRVVALMWGIGMSVAAALIMSATDFLWKP